MKLANPISCTACMACIDSCQHNALSLSLDDNGFYCIKKDVVDCVNCGLCAHVCPVLIPPSPIDKDKLILSKPFAAWCEDDDLRSKSASGGAFAAIAKAFLEQGAIVYGASIDGFEIRHKRIEHCEDLHFILGSKYQPSRMDGVYHQVYKDLRENKTVLFSGLSCQVAGMLNFVPEKLRSNLFTIDTICGGVSTMLPMLKLKSTEKYTGIHSFRNKNNGWRSTGYKYNLKMYLYDGEVADLGIDNMVLRSFCHKETKRSSCLNCLFNGFHRESDVTIGDFWGDTRFAEQHYKGVSVLIIHSERIKDALDKSLLHIEPITWTELIGSNPNVYWSHQPYLLKSLTRKRIFSKLRKGDDGTATRILEKSVLKRVETYIFLRKNERERKRYLDRTLNEHRDI